MIPESDADVWISLAGGFDVYRRGELVAGAALGSRKGRTLLHILAVERRHTVSVERITDLLWSGSAPARAGDNVSTLVSRLRRALGAAVVQGSRAGYRLGNAVGVDLDAASSWVTGAETDFGAGDAGLAISAATRAADLLAADPSGVHADVEWARPAREELRELTRRIQLVLAAAALDLGRAAEARASARAVLDADPFDESACRLLMRAHESAGDRAHALEVFADLKALLVRELGTDPSPETRAVHLAILREEPFLGKAGAGRSWLPIGLVGRADEFGTLRAAWNDAAASMPALMLVVGEAGMGKTRLCAEWSKVAGATGATVLQARCYEAERSLLLQPIADALDSAFRLLPMGRLRAAAGDAGRVFAGLSDEAAAALGIAPSVERGPLPTDLRRTFEALTAFLRQLSATDPVLFVLDDLQNAGRATVEFLHYLARHLRDGRVLVLATVRAGEGDDVVDELIDVSRRLDVGPLGGAAVTELALASGQAEFADQILARTRGHTLFVVETLRGLRDGADGIPLSLRDAVLLRVRRAGRDVDELLRAAAVLGSSFTPAVVAGLLEKPLRAVVSRSEEALEARLLVVSGDEYEFVNDLVREVLYDSTPRPARLAYHRRAADLLTNQPEAVGLHAHAAQDWSRAARAWLLAGENALQRCAGPDAEDLLTRCLDSADRSREPEIAGRALVARSRSLSARGQSDRAMADLDAALRFARTAGDRRLEMLARRALGGDAPIAHGLAIRQATGHLREGLSIAISLGDRAAEADFSAWLAILACNGLRFDEADEHSRNAIAAARSSGDERALAAALDGRKTAVAYLGEIGQLVPVVQELEPLLRRLGDTFRLPWVLFESGFPAVAAGRWVVAESAFTSALEATRRAGLTVYLAWYVAHLGWLARLHGDYPAALRLGREAMSLNERAPHGWCGASAAALLGTTLIETGSGSAAIEILERGCSMADLEGSEAYLLRCLGPLAQSSGSGELLRQADEMIARIAAPPGSAWLLGSDSYLAVARAWLARNDADRARRVLAPLIAAAARVPWVAPLAAGCLVDAMAAEQLGLHQESRSLLSRSAHLTRRHHLASAGQAPADR